MNHLLRGGVRWYWTKDQTDAMNRLKEDLQKDVLLSTIDYEYPIVMQCDASEIGLRAVLVQKVQNKDRPIMFISKTLKQSERSAHIYEKEMYAVIWAYDRFREFIEGHPFTIQTDNQAVRYLDKMKSTKAKLTRWAIEISSWGASWILTPSKHNVVADTLSRNPVPESPSDPTLHDIRDQLDMPLTLNNTKDHMMLPFILLTFCTPTIRDIIKKQQEDPELMQIINILKTIPHSKHHKNYSFEGNLLVRKIKPFPKCTTRVKDLRPKAIIETVCLRNCRQHDHSQLPRTENERSRDSDFSNPFYSSHSNMTLDSEDGTPSTKSVHVPVIPRSMYGTFLHLFHDTPESGHMGRNKTLDRLKQRCYFNNMNSIVADYVRSCKICQKSKPVNHKPFGLMQTHRPPSKVFETIHIDFMGPFPASAGGKQNKYLFVVVDELSKWPELFPMREATVQKMLENLENEIFCRFGAPKTIISDNGAQLIADLMKQACQKRRITHRFISPYSPQSNQSERINRNLVSMSYIENCHSKWD